MSAFRPGKRVWREARGYLSRHREVNGSQRTFACGPTSGRVARQVAKGWQPDQERRYMIV